MVESLRSFFHILREINAQVRRALCGRVASDRSRSMRLAAFPARWAVVAALSSITAPQAAQAADVAAGKAIFEHTCLNCHALEVGVNKVGPSLWHVVGRPSATVEGYAYSDAMKNLHGVWTPEALNIYLANPRGDVHGVKMFFKGLSDPQDRQNVIAYLQSLQ
jgi:cytochrome c